MLWLLFGLALFAGAYRFLVPLLARQLGDDPQAAGAPGPRLSPWSLMLSQVATVALGPLLVGCYLAFKLHGWSLVVIPFFYIALALVLHFLVASRALAGQRQSLVALLGPRLPTFARHILALLVVLVSVFNLHLAMSDFKLRPWHDDGLVGVGLVLLASWAVIGRNRWVFRYLLPLLALLMLGGALAALVLALMGGKAQWQLDAAHFTALPALGDATLLLASFLGTLALVPSLAGQGSGPRQGALIGAAPVLLNGALTLVWAVLTLVLLGPATQDQADSPFFLWGAIDNLVEALGLSPHLWLKLWMQLPVLALLLVSLRAARLAWADALAFDQQSLGRRCLLGLPVLLLLVGTTLDDDGPQMLGIFALGSGVLVGLWVTLALFWQSRRPGHWPWWPLAAWALCALLAISYAWTMVLWSLQSLGWYLGEMGSWALGLVLLAGLTVLAWRHRPRGAA